MDIDEYPDVRLRDVVVDEYEEDLGNIHDDAEEENAEGASEDEDSEDDTGGYGFMSGHYNVRVTDILVDEGDTSYLPTKE